MCIMSVAELESMVEGQRQRAAISVASTRLFARHDHEHQYLVYQMAIDAPAELVMVLPLPVSRIADDAIDFIDLSAVPTLFDHLQKCFEPPRSRSLGPHSFSAPAPQSLKVHRVGSFAASWVPTLADMTRLDPRFRLDDQVWRDLPQLADHGFAVFQLQPGAHTIHPMALRFPTREQDAIYFPTVHVHDGTVHRDADFDHELYFQASGRPRVLPPAGPTVALEQAYEEPMSDLTQGVLVDDEPLYRVQLRGTRANADTRVRL